MSNGNANISNFVVGTDVLASPPPPAIPAPVPTPPIEGLGLGLATPLGMPLGLATPLGLPPVASATTPVAMTTDFTSSNKFKLMLAGGVVGVVGALMVGGRAMIGALWGAAAGFALGMYQDSAHTPMTIDQLLNSTESLTSEGIAALQTEYNNLKNSPAGQDVSAQMTAIQAKLASNGVSTATTATPSTTSSFSGSRRGGADAFMDSGNAQAYMG